MTTASAFELESELCAVLSDRIADVLERDGARPMMPLGEVQVGLVIPDLVFVSSAICLAQRPVELSGFDTWIVAELLRARPRCAKTLAARLFARPEKTTKALHRLERIGVLHRESDAAFMLRDWFPTDSEVVAVEAKLARWRDAVDQAEEYLHFANRSYVALPTETVTRSTELKAECRKRRLGLLAVSRQGVELVREAPLHRPRTPAWVWLVARALDEQRRATATMPSPARRAMRVGGQGPYARGSRPARRP